MAATALDARLPGAPRPARRFALGLLLALAHLGVWQWLDGRPVPSRQPVPDGVRTTLIAVRLPVPRAVPADAGIGAPRAAVIHKAPRSPLPSPAPVPVVAVPTPEETKAPPAMPSPDPEPPVRLLDSDATRRALREAARQPLLVERTAAALGEGDPLRPEQKLGQQIQRAATGDCLKGEFAGAGLGLLSLPFWALAEVRGKCRR